MSISKKRLLALLLSVLMLLSCAMLTACGKSRDDDDDDDEPREKSTWETPIQNTVKRINDRQFDFEERFVTMYDGLGRAELQEIFDILSRSDSYDEIAEDLQDDWTANCEGYDDEYGSDWEYTYEVTEKEALDESDLEECQDEIAECAAALKDVVDYLNALTDHDYEELADDMGIDKDDFSRLMSALSELVETLEQAELSEGYNVKVDMTMGGEDDSETKGQMYYVAKTGSLWINPYRCSASYLFNYLQMFGLSFD